MKYSERDELLIEAIFELHKAEKSIVEIARALGLHPWKVAVFLSKKGVPYDKKFKLPRWLTYQKKN